MTNIWQTLDHDTIFKAIEKTTNKTLSGLLLQRNSYINRVHEIEEKNTGTRFIVKFYRPERWTKKMILEEHKFLFDLSKNDIPVIPPLEFNERSLFENNGFLFAIFPKKGGRALDEFNEESWQIIGRELARIHNIGEKHKNAERIKWEPKISVAHQLDVLFRTDYVLEEFKIPFKNAAELFIKKAEPLFKDQGSILLHGDCHKGNLIHRPNEGIYFIDFDDICLGPPVQDVWMLLPDVVADNCEKEINWFLKGYETFRPFNRSSLKLIPALRGMRIIHYVSWLAIQCSESGFKKHFPHVGTKKYWNEIIKDIHSIIYEEL